MDNHKQQPQIDLSKTQPLKTWSGSHTWVQGYILRQVSASPDGPTEDGVIPIRVFFDPVDGRILTNTLPIELRAEYEGKSIEEIQQGNINQEEIFKKEQENNPWDQPWDWNSSQPTNTQNTNNPDSPTTVNWGV